MSNRNRDRARYLRTNMTDTERFVWQRIRYRQIGGFKFRRQHPMGPFIVDFVCLERKLVLELDGGQHAERAEYDARRTEWLEERGYRVFRLWNCEAIKDWEAAEQRIWELIHDGQAVTPHPPLRGDLPLKGGGEELGVLRGSLKGGGGEANGDALGPSPQGAGQQPDRQVFTSPLEGEVGERSEPGGG